MDVQDHMTGITTWSRLLRVGVVALVAVVVGPVGSAMADAPHVGINSPSNGSVSAQTPAFSGYGDPEPEDGGVVTLTIYEGPIAGGKVIQTTTTTPVKWKEAEPMPEPWEGPGHEGFDSGTWSVVPAALPGGTYTAQAMQTTTPSEGSSFPVETAVSAPVTFTVETTTSSPPPVEPVQPRPLTPPGPPPLTASFSWFPSVPQIGQNVSLVSTSTDSASPITAFAWALMGNGAFAAGGPLMTTSFSTPGSHVVQLNVTDANGRSSVASRTIQVTSAPVILMQPFPIVRIAGSETTSGVRLRLLTALAPIGARVTVSCRGHGCPTKSEGQVALSRKSNSGTVIVEFRRFERSLKAGVILEIRITKPGQIGKFTRFVVRRGKLPVRVDTCLDAAGVTPLVCPS
jgi:PKD domain